MSAVLILKKVFIITAVATIGVIAFLVHALGGLGAQPVVYADPPAFVEQYVSNMRQSDSSPVPQRFETVSEQAPESDFAELTADLSKEEAFVFNAIMTGTSVETLSHYFTHHEKAQRVKVASALAAVNTRFTHDEESGFAEKRSEFWIDVEEFLPDIQNALSEALIVSAEERTRTYIPYTLMWMPGQGHETIELFAWAANHHSDPWVRRFCINMVVRFGEDEELTRQLLRSGVHDPDYNVRKEVLGRRYARFMQMVKPAAST